MGFDFDEPPFAIVQSVTTWNQKHVLRGMHCSPYPKLVSCRKGNIFDVLVSPEGAVQTFTLTAGDTLLVPADHAHGYFCLQESCIGYFLGGTFVPELEKYFHWRDPALAIPWPLGGAQPIVNARDEAAPLFRPIYAVVLGAKGFLGQALLHHVPGAVACDVRLEDTSALRATLSFVRPKHVLSAAGVSGKPTIDWCEAQPAETLYANVTCQLNLMEVCRDLGLHLTVLGSGGAFGEGVYSDDDTPRGSGSVYARLRAHLETFLPYFHNVLYLRVHYPISGDGHEKCFLSKLQCRRACVHRASVSTTVIPSMFPLINRLLEANVAGIFNFVNDGSVTLEEILQTTGSGDYTLAMEESNRPATELRPDKLRALLPVETTLDALRAFHL